MTFTPGQPARTRGVWEERPDARHAVQASGTAAQDGVPLYVGIPPATDCGVQLPVGVPLLVLPSAGGRRAEVSGVQRG